MKKINRIPTENEFKETLNKTLNYLKNENSVQAIILFGSYARGDYSLRHSDIDLYILISGEKDFEFERKFWRDTNNFHKNIQVHLNFEYQKLNSESSLLRYNILKEGKILFQRNKIIFLKEDFDLIEVLSIKINLTYLKPNQKFNFKRSMLTKYKKEVLYYSGNNIIIKKDFLTNFYIITKNKNIDYEILFEFLYRPKQEYDED